MVKMHNEMLCYVYWVRLLATWDPAHHDHEGDGVPDDRESCHSTSTDQLRDQAEISRHDTEELVKFFGEHLHQRHLGTSSGRIGRNSKAADLKTLVAPYLGLSAISNNHDKQDG